MPANQIDVKEARERFEELLSRVLSGEEWILTDGEKPVARLTPVSRRIPGLHENAISISPDFDAPLPDEFWLEKA